MGRAKSSRRSSGYAIGILAIAYTNFEWHHHLMPHAAYPVNSMCSLIDFHLHSFSMSGVDQVWIIAEDENQAEQIRKIVPAAIVKHNSLPKEELCWVSVCAIPEERKKFGETEANAVISGMIMAASSTTNLTVNQTISKFHLEPFGALYSHKCLSRKGMNDPLELQNSLNMVVNTNKKSFASCRLPIVLDTILWLKHLIWFNDHNTYEDRVKVGWGTFNWIRNLIRSGEKKVLNTSFYLDLTSKRNLALSKNYNSFFEHLDPYEIYRYE